MAAYNRGDYVPAIRLFRPLAEQGNPKAQSVIGQMYRKGEGVARSSAHAFMWFSLAAKRGRRPGKSGIARGFTSHDTGRNLPGARFDAGLRDLELSDLRVLSTRPCQARARMMWAWILADTSPLPCRLSMADAAWSVAASSRSEPLASISLRSGVPWQ